MNVILFGYRGCGKTTLGQKLAGKLWKGFVDTDAQVRRRFGGMEVADIWAQYGEPAFRTAETEAAVQALSMENQVIALGGGTLMQQGARDAVASAENAKRVYLSCDPAVLLTRINGDTATAGQRPSLTGDGSASDAGLAEIQHVLAERDPIYRAAADAVLDVTYCSVDEAVTHLVALV